MEVKIKKAMVLAAGLGTRLRPVTFKTPKPLLHVGSQTLIDFSLQYLARHKISDVMINLHHLGDMIRDHVGDGARYGLKVSYSFEPEILGTGGGIKNCEEFFEGKPFVAMNSDSLLSADLDRAIERHLESSASATMVLKKRGPGDPYEPINVENGFVNGIGKKGDYFYTGLQIIGPDLLRELPPKGQVSCLIKDGYQKLLVKGKKVAAFLYDGYFNDIGTPERYEQAKRDIAEGILKA